MNSALSLSILNQQDLTSCNTLGLTAYASHLVRYQTDDDLAQIATLAQRHRHVFVLGGGSNVVLPTHFSGLVIKVESSGVRLLETTSTHYLIEAQAGQVWHDFVDTCISKGWYGLENLALIPGTVGAAPVQNIGAYGVELQQYVHSLLAYDLHTATTVELSGSECEFAYRDSFFKRQPMGQWLILRVRFCLPIQWAPVLTYPDLQRHPGLLLGADHVTARQVFNAVSEIRASKLPDPAVLANAGSFFKNPIVDQDTYTLLKARWPDLVAYPQTDQRYKLAAGWLIDQAGWKGKRLGPVGVHSRQALVLVHHGGGCADDIHALADTLRADVHQRFGVVLEQEPLNVASR